MRVITTVAEARHQVRSARARGERIGLVPTLGNLHEGHQALVRVAHAQCDFVVVSAYSNSDKLLSGDDHGQWAGVGDADSDLASAAGADLLWAPTRDEIDPPGARTMVTVGAMGNLLCGKSLSGRFDAIATLIVKLVGVVTPDVLYLGEKDYQEAILLHHVARDLHIPVEVRTVPTVRDPDGIALSSRNRLLSGDQRAAARSILRALDAIVEAVNAGERSAGRLRARAEVMIGDDPLVGVEYVEIVNPDTLERVDTIDRPAMLLVAATVGGIRLIDNRRLEASADRVPA